MAGAMEGVGILGRCHDGPCWAVAAAWERGLKQEPHLSPFAARTAASWRS